MDQQFVAQILGRLFTDVAMKLIERYTLQACVLLTLIGLAFLIASFAWAPAYTEFDGGDRTVGRIISLTEDPVPEPYAAALVTWNTQGTSWNPIQHQAEVRVLKRAPDQPLRPGTDLPLVLSKENPEAAISAEVIDAEAGGLVTIMGARAVDVPFFIGLICFAAGAGSLIYAMPRR